MTSYRYTITFSQNEFKALEAALEFYQKECRRQLVEKHEQGKCLAPHWAHNQSIDEINEKISETISRICKINLDDLTK